MPFKDNEWKPNNPKQIAFLGLPNSIFEGLFGGGAGTGKSEILMMYSIVRGWYNQQGFKQLFLRRTYPELKREIIPRSQDMYARLGGKFNKSDLVWTFPREDQYGSGFANDGGMIFFGHCEHEKDAKNYDGVEINLLSFDEITSFTEYIYTYIALSRVRTSNPNLPAVVRSSGMPGDVGHTFVKKRFIDPCPTGNKLILGKGGNKRIYIHTTLNDNIDGDPTYGQKLDGLNEAERKAKKFGDWTSFEGTVFDELRDKHHVGEPEHAVHVVEPFAIPDHWPKVIAIDWGYAANCSVGFAAISPEPRTYVYRRLGFKRKKIEEWAPDVRFFVDKDKPIDAVICHSAGQNRGDAQNIHQQVSEALGIPFRLGERDRIGGKTLIHEYLRWKEPDVVKVDPNQYSHDTAQWLLRNKSLAEYNRYIASFTETPKQVLPKLRFFDTPEVRNILDALRACTYAKSSTDGKAKEDVAEFEGDDDYDMLRMLVRSADQFMGMGSETQAKLTAIENVNQQLLKTADVTAYYRNMRKLESEERGAMKVVKRFHRGRR